MSDHIYVPLQPWECALCGAKGRYELPGGSYLANVLALAGAHCRRNPLCARWGVEYLSPDPPHPPPETDASTPPAAVEPEKARDPSIPSSWGNTCSRGFVRDARFGSGQVIPGTNRAMQRKQRRVL